jgi:hypothetical protein
VFAGLGLVFMSTARAWTSVLGAVAAASSALFVYLDARGHPRRSGSFGLGLAHVRVRRIERCEEAPQPALTAGGAANRGLETRTHRAWARAGPSLRRPSHRPSPSRRLRQLKMAAVLQPMPAPSPPIPADGSAPSGAPAIDSSSQPDVSHVPTELALASSEA